MTRFLFLILLACIISTSAGAETLPRLKTSGNHLETPDGKPVTLRGVSLCSLEWHNPLKQINQVMEGDQSWPVDVLRLPVQIKEWDRYGAKNYLKNNLDPAVALCKKHNVYCIIDWHEIGDWNKPDRMKKLEDFWRIVAIRYANDPRIIYEIYNEPVGPAEQTHENWLAWRDKMQGWVNKIRVDAPHTLLLVGSPHWSQMPSFAVKDPVKGDNLAYVMHLYPNWKPEQWDVLFGNASKTIPIFMTEWGWSTQNKDDFVLYGTRKTYGEPLKAYLSERPNINWTAWSYDPLCGPAMLGKDTDMADFVKEWLKEERAKKN